MAPSRAGAQAGGSAARELSDAFVLLARRLPGEPLQTFARRFVPRVTSLLGQDPDPVTGILSEGTRSSEHRASATLVVDDAVAEPSTAPLPRDPESTSSRGLLVGSALVGGLGAFAVVGILGVLALGIAALAWTLPSDTGVATSSPQSGEASAASRVEASSAPDKLPKASSPGGIADEPPDVEGSAEPKADEPPADGAPAPEEAEEAPAPEPSTRAVTPPTAAPQPAHAQAAPAPVGPKEPDPDAPKVRRALVVLDAASSLSVDCGGVRASGTVSASIRSFPPGTCVIEAVVLGRRWDAEVVIDRPREVRCTVSGESLSCS